ncbi:MAG TPA: PaaI family thioesterase [Candidatus Dormibacteraeota bacterium]|nr:PaaI family thioesterase [Candidatus Dormibacteraeota bacterium]
MRRLLSNTFGFESNCWVCEPTNPAGLRVPFHHDDVDHTVTATLRLDAHHSGAPNLVHGGLLAALCDDAMAWAAIAEAHRFALTAETRLSYLAPVPVDEELTVTARLIGGHRRQLWLMAEVRCGGTVCVRAESRATAMGEELAHDAGVPAEAGGALPETRMESD